MLTRQHYAILEYITETEYITAQALADKLNISERSVRTRIKEINSECKGKGILIQSKARHGFFADSDSKVHIRSLLDKDKSMSDIPVSAEERLQFLCVYLLNLKTYIKMEDLCDMMFISKGTLSSTLKETEKMYSDFNIRIIRRPNYGIKAEGTEFDIRPLSLRCIRKSKIPLGSRTASSAADFTVYRAGRRTAYKNIRQNILGNCFPGICRLYLYSHTQNAGRILSFHRCKQKRLCRKKGLLFCRNFDR